MTIKWKEGEYFVVTVAMWMALILSFATDKPEIRQSALDALIALWIYSRIVRLEMKQ